MLLWTVIFLLTKVNLISTLPLTPAFISVYTSEESCLFLQSEPSLNCNTYWHNMIDYHSFTLSALFLSMFCIFRLKLSNLLIYTWSVSYFHFFVHLFLGCVTKFNPYTTRKWASEIFYIRLDFMTSNRSWPILLPGLWIQ